MLGASLLLSGCSGPPATPSPETSDPTTTAEASQTPVTMPAVTDGSVEFASIDLAKIPVTPEFTNLVGTDPAASKQAIETGMNAIRIFNLDYANRKTISTQVTKEDKDAILAELDGKLKPLMSAQTWELFVQKWNQNTAENSDSIFMMNTATTKEDQKWDNPSNLECGMSENIPWTTTFSEPQLTTVPVEGQDYQAAALKIKAHYLIPCAEGKVLKNVMQWELMLGSETLNNDWKVYRWSRTPLGNPEYVQ